MHGDLAPKRPRLGVQSPVGEAASPGQRGAEAAPGLGLELGPRRTPRTDGAADPGAAGRLERAKGGAWRRANPDQGAIPRGGGEGKGRLGASLPHAAAGLGTARTGTRRRAGTGTAPAWTARLAGAEREAGGQQSRRHDRAPKRNRERIWGARARAVTTPLQRARARMPRPGPGSSPRPGSRPPGPIRTRVPGEQSRAGSPI